MPDNDARDDPFGFAPASRSVQEKIRQIKPSAPAHGPEPDLARVDAVADNAGFVSREVTAEYIYRTGRTQRPEPRIPLNMRVPVSLGAAFQRFCEENRYSYPEALAEVMRRAGLPTR